MKIVRFVVSVIKPDGVSIGDLQEYIGDAIAFVRGSFSPDNPLFYLEKEHIKVERMKIIPKLDFGKSAAEIITKNQIGIEVKTVNDDEAQELYSAWRDEIFSQAAKYAN